MRLKNKASSTLWSGEVQILDQNHPILRNLEYYALPQLNFKAVFAVPHLLSCWRLQHAGL